MRSRATSRSFAHIVAGRRSTLAPVGVLEVVRSYGEAWNERAESARRSLLEQAWTDDGVYSDPLGRAEGRDALVTHIAQFHETMPGHRIELTSEPDEHDGFLRFTWEMTGDDAVQVMEGIDFGELAPDGRLRRITGFFGAPPTI